MKKTKFQILILIFILILFSAILINETEIIKPLHKNQDLKYDYTKDIVCGNECEVYINVSSPYYKFKFEQLNANDQVYIYENDKLIKTTFEKDPEIITYKKWKYSRTIYVNLNNIDKIAFTNPKVKVDVLVPKKDDWRLIKDGDKLNKIKLLIYKEPWQNAKWSFVIKDYVDIDPDLYSIYSPEDNCNYLNISYIEKAINTTIENICMMNVCDKANKSCVQEQVCYNTTLTNLINVTSFNIRCEKDSEVIKYINDTLETEKLGIKCKYDKNNMLCDEVEGKDGNGDGICQSGETCYKYNLTDKIELIEIKNGDKIIK